RGAARLALLPGTPPPDVFAAARTRITEDGRLAGVTGRVVLDEAGAALVPVEPGRANGPWLSAASPQLTAMLGGRYADGWLAPSGRVRLFRAGSLTFTVVAPEG